MSNRIQTISLNRRSSHLIAFISLGLTLLLVVPSARSEGDIGSDLWSPTRLQMFVDELPAIPKLYGYGVVDGKPVSKSLQIGMFYKKWKFHRDLPATPVFAYGTSKRTATIPGPTIEAIQGVDTYVTWQNHLPPHHILPWDKTIPVAEPASKTGIPTVVHLHGGIHAPTSDGHSHAWFTAGFKDKGATWSNVTYHYPNQQHPGNLWYHDHAMGLTRVNLLAGLAGAYVVRQPSVEAPLRLPSGDEFDRVLVVSDRGFLKNGSIYMDSKGNNPTIHPEWQPEYFGDVILVNGKAWPKLTVRRRKYRFRIINTSNARFFRLQLSNGLHFIHVGSDSAYLHKPIKTKRFLLAPSEIADVIVDFSKSHSDHAILLNSASYPFPSGDPVNEANSKVMRFTILGELESDTSRVPIKLLNYPSPDLLSGAVRTRYIALYEYESSTDEPTHLYINGLSYDAPATEIPKAGTSEVWYMINLTDDNHPIHVHLGLFVALDQTELVEIDEFKTCMQKVNDAERCGVHRHARGKYTPVPEYEKGWKNVFKLQPGHVTKLYLRFSYIHTDELYRFDATAEPGYIYHCHILDHEDNVMMRPLKLSN
ncbi:hypothetical protein V2J09_001621 [Rumex salicifolius]